MVTVGVDIGLKVKLPYLGFLITNGDKNILFDDGINSKFIVVGKAWAGSPAKAGEAFALEALKNVGLGSSRNELKGFNDKSRQISRGSMAFKMPV
jgi:hypothetical protein